MNRVIPYDGGCYTFYTMMSASGRAAAAEEGLANTPVSDAPSVTPVSASAGLTAWGSGVSSITGTPSAWAAGTITRAEIYGITMLSDGSYQSPITRRTLARLAANTARTLGLVEDVSDSSTRTSARTSRSAASSSMQPTLRFCACRMRRRARPSP